MSEHEVLAFNETNPSGNWKVMCALGSVALYLGSYYLLYPAAPMRAAEIGTSGSGGYVNGALLLASLTCGFAVPSISARLGRTGGLFLGYLIVAIASMGQAGSASVTGLILWNLIRGVGLSCLFVLGAPVLVSLVSEAARTRTLGLYGVAASLPAIVFQPIGPWLYVHFGFTFVCLISGACVVVAAILLLLAQTGQASRTHEGPIGSSFTAFRSRRVQLAAAGFFLSALVAGAVVTFIPILAGPGTSGLVGLALLGHGCAIAASRWALGRWVAPHYRSRGLVALICLCVAGLLTLSLNHGAPAVLLCLFLVGAGFGGCQTLSLDLVFEASDNNHDGASLVWNVAYDGGLALGALFVGCLSNLVSLDAAFATLGLLTIVGLAVLKRL